MKNLYQKIVDREESIALVGLGYVGMPIAIMAAVCFTATCFAKDIKIVVLNTDPQMHCANCESKIKNNIRFEKGIKEIETNLADKTVTIKYDADKTTVEKIIAGFAKIHYTATVVENESKQKDDIRGKQPKADEDGCKQERGKQMRCYVIRGKKRWNGYFGNSFAPLRGFK